MGIWISKMVWLYCEIHRIIMSVSDSRVIDKEYDTWTWNAKFLSNKLKMKLQIACVHQSKTKAPPVNAAAKKPCTIYDIIYSQPLFPCELNNILTAWHTLKSINVSLGVWETLAISCLIYQSQKNMYTDRSFLQKPLPASTLQVPREPHMYKN